jgi:hypothetical protein
MSVSVCQYMNFANGNCRFGQIYARQIRKGEPPALPGGSSSLTFPGVGPGFSVFECWTVTQMIEAMKIARIAAEGCEYWHNRSYAQDPKGKLA